MATQFKVGDKFKNNTNGSMVYIESIETSKLPIPLHVRVVEDDYTFYRIAPHSEPVTMFNSEWLSVTTFTRLVNNGAFTKF